MLERALRLAAIICSLLVVAGWGWFAADETGAASRDTQAEIAGQVATRTVDPDPDQERAREQAHGKVHEYVDDANDVLLRPFAAVTADSSSKWLRRSIPALLALVVYGFGLGLLARFAAGR
ncbi:MAG TPA: hypothetical protein VK501_07950 [Baekduia sp.]|uniref:hypothetical protein n=1 Tax=Baekduia sp. TaxID=2600305 RepID=UPI002B72F1AB|nr:hypothetical protein [Baekduia sp.]HMJ33835.1 hypothetical protein [Baekduia sp.]